MLRASFALILFACLSVWCTSQNIFQLPELHVLKKITKFPPNIPTCLGDDPNIIDCIKNTYQTLKSRLKNGIAELNLQSLDPLEIDTFEMFIELVNAVVQLDHFRIFGIDDTEVEELDLNVSSDNVSLKLNTQTPHIYHEGLYEVNFEINNEKIHREGYFNGTLTDLKLNTTIEVDLEQRGIHEHLQVKNINFEPDIANLTFCAENLAEEEDLNDFILNHINENWNFYYKFLIDAIKKDLEPFVLHILNAYTDAYTDLICSQILSHKY